MFIGTSSSSSFKSLHAWIVELNKATGLDHVGSVKMKCFICRQHGGVGGASNNQATLTDTVIGSRYGAVATLLVTRITDPVVGEIRQPSVAYIEEFCGNIMATCTF